MKRETRVCRPDKTQQEAEGFHNSNSSPNVIRIISSRRMAWGGWVITMKGMRNAYEILVRKPEMKISLRRCRRNGAAVINASYRSRI